MIAIVAAMTRNLVIGKNGKLPWNIREDMKRFKDITMGGAVIMGRKTYESIGRPLPGRTNIVLTSQDIRIPGVIVAKSLNEAITMTAENCFVIGGAEVFKQALPLADIMYLTIIDSEVEGDTYFPYYNDARLNPNPHDPQPWLYREGYSFTAKSGEHVVFETLVRQT